MAQDEFPPAARGARQPDDPTSPHPSDDKSVKTRARDVWRAVPSVVRKTLVSVIGGSLVLLGFALIVLPGPFTIPLLVAGFFVLGTEFAWAATVLARTRSAMTTATKVTKRAVSAATKPVRRK